MTKTEAISLINDINETIADIDKHDYNGEISPTVYEALLNKDLEHFNCIAYDKDMIQELINDSLESVPPLITMTRELISLIYKYHYKLDEVSDDLTCVRKENSINKSMRDYYQKEVTSLNLRIKELENEAKNV